MERSKDRKPVSPKRFSHLGGGGGSSTESSAFALPPWMRQQSQKAMSTEKKQPWNTMKVAVKAVTATGAGVASSDAALTVDKFYPYEQLRDNPPDGVERSLREHYLSDADFEALFGVSKEIFFAQPKWKRTQAKKRHGLF